MVRRGNTAKTIAVTATNTSAAGACASAAPVNLPAAYTSPLLFAIAAPIVTPVTRHKTSTEPAATARVEANHRTARQRRGQQQLDSTFGLLGPHAEDCLHASCGREHARDADQGGGEDVDDASRAAGNEAADEVAERFIALDGVGDDGPKSAGDRPEHSHSDAPTEEGGALESPREPERTAAAEAGLAAATAFRHQARSQVAARLQGERRQCGDDEGDEGEQQRGERRLGERTRRLSPSDR